MKKNKNIYTNINQKKFRSILRKILHSLRRKNLILNFSFQKSLNEFPYCYVHYRMANVLRPELRISFTYSATILNGGLHPYRADHFMDKEHFIFSSFSPKQLRQAILSSIKDRIRGLGREYAALPILKTLVGRENIQEISIASAKENIEGADYFIKLTSGEVIGLDIKSSLCGVNAAKEKHPHVLSFRMLDEYFLPENKKTFTDEFCRNFRGFIQMFNANPSYRAATG